MTTGETVIEMAQRHVREGERHVAHQRGVLDRLSRDGLPTAMARTLLKEFEATLRDHRASLARIVEEQREGRRDADGGLL